MNDVQKANILRTAMAMTAPEYANERYYYDSVTELFFYAKQIGDNEVALYSLLDFPLSERQYGDISIRFEQVDDYDFEIVEIPRLNVSEKIEIQLDFLSQFYRVYHLEELISAVENQQDDYRMVLDTALIKNSYCAPMAAYWDEFKLKTMFDYIKHFTNSIGVQVSFD
jgi:hypothetical protein